MSSLPKGFQEPLNYALVDVEWIRRLDLAGDSHGTPPCKGTGSDQIHLPHPLTCLPPHLLPGPPQNLGGTPE